MNELTSITSPQTMSSRDIADLCEKEHKNVIRDIREMLEELHGEGGRLKFEHSYLNSQNKEQPEFKLPKRETLILVSGYRLDLRTKIIDRWQELEDHALNPYAAQLPTDFPSALRALADQTEETGKLIEQIEHDAPKVAFADQVAMAPDAISLAKAAKLLNTGRNRLCSKLRQMAWLNRTNEPYQAKIEAGLLDVQLSTWKHPNMGLQPSVTALVTGKGLAKLHTIFEASERAGL